MTVRLVTDSTSYIDPQTQLELDIKTVNLSVHFPDESFDETAVSHEYFYKKIDESNTIPTSSQPTVGEMYDVFKDIVMRGEQVLGIFISSKMSGTYETALSAKQMVLEEYPQALIEILDSKTNCMAMGIQVIEAAIAAKAGKKMEEVKTIAQQISEKVHFYFVPATLDYLIKGGRIGGAAALIGSLLNIRPLLFVNNDGVADVFNKFRGTKKAIDHMLKILQEDAKKHGLKHLIVHHIFNEEQGQKLADNLSRQYNRHVPIQSIGPVIGTHVGPGAIGIVYCTE